MKKLCFVVLFVLLLSASAAASATDQILKQYQDKSSQFVIGLDATCLFASMDVNGFNFPTRMIGMSPSLGLDYRKFTNIPDKLEIEDICKAVLKDNPGVDKDSEKFLSLVYKKAHPGNFKYFQIGTEMLICPKIGVGMLIPFSRDMENNTYIDLGICFPWLVNVGFLIGF